MKRPYTITTNETVVGEGHSLREEMAGQPLTAVNLYQAHFTIRFAADSHADAAKIIKEFEDALRSPGIPELDIRLLWSLYGRAEVPPPQAVPVVRKMPQSKKRKK